MKNHFPAADIRQTWRISRDGHWYRTIGVITPHTAHWRAYTEEHGDDLEWAVRAALHSCGVGSAWVQLPLWGVPVMGVDGDDL